MADSLRGKRILVTGATSGIGEALVRRLVAQGAEVLLHGRDAVRTRALNAELASGSEQASVQALVADLASLASVAQLAASVLANGGLDILVNNAGVGFGRDRKQREISADGLELRMAVNFLAPFLLTELLTSQQQPRLAVINVASAGQAPIDRADLMNARDYDGVLAYRRSKLALIADTFQRAASDPARRYLALHPGTFLATKMVLEAKISPQGSADSGADAVLHAIARAIAGDTGFYLDGKRRAAPDASASDPETQNWLRAEALRLTAPFR